jgi:hypothetical protein
MNLDQWKEKVNAGGFQTLGFVRRALAHSSLGKAERKTVLVIASSYFDQNPSPPRNSNAPKPKPKKDFALGTNGIGTDGEGDCLAVTMCTIALDPKMRDAVNRLLSQAREEGDITLPLLSSRFARLCKVAGRANGT